MSFKDDLVRLYTAYKQGQDGFVGTYKPTEHDLAAAEIAAKYPEHLLRAAVVMSGIHSRKVLRENGKL